MTQDSESVVVPRVKEFVSQLTAALRVAYKANGGIAAIARRTHGAALIRNIATLEAAKVFEGLAAAPSTSVREEGEIKRLRAAMQPFADMADEIERVADAQGWSRDSIRRSHRYDQCVAARAALVPSPDEGKRHG